MIINPSQSTAELAPNVSYRRFIFSSHFEEYPMMRTNETEEIIYHFTNHTITDLWKQANQSK